MTKSRFNGEKDIECMTGNIMHLSRRKGEKEEEEERRASIHRDAAAVAAAGAAFTIPHLLSVVRAM